MTPLRRGVRFSSLAVLALLLVAGAARAQQERRVVRGQVLDADGKEVPNAIVHLKNTTTDDVLSVVTDKEGRYRFSEVDKKVDYEIRAEWRDQKSRVRKISQFDTRDLVTINLVLEPAETSGGKDSSGKDRKELV